MAGLERKNAWTIAEHAGEMHPAGMQRLPQSADWDVDGVRDDVRDLAVEHLGEAGRVLIVDETGFVKKRTDLQPPSQPSARGRHGRPITC
ncbi:SRSO17 transposase [Phytomonospora endophytica]|uniref:SRSO17 transposase n=1 Tax=Phytomonospora endophytica TaxID=714109 RepID=A0A841FRW4_9ACTN|nr:SRSO17 transposase [Phytomonospora endophytica]